MQHRLTQIEKGLQIDLGVPTNDEGDGGSSSLSVARTVAEANMNRSENHEIMTELRSLLPEYSRLLPCPFLILHMANCADEALIRQHTIVRMPKLNNADSEWLKSYISTFKEPGDPRPDQYRNPKSGGSPTSSDDNNRGRNPDAENTEASKTFNPDVIRLHPSTEYNSSGQDNDPDIIS